MYSCDTHDPSEVILKRWLGAQETFLIIIHVGNSFYTIQNIESLSTRSA